MYCRKCGKEIDYDASFCKECEEKFLRMTDVEEICKTQTEPETTIAPIAENVEETALAIAEVATLEEDNKEIEKTVEIKEETAKGSRTTGFKLALTSLILGVCIIVISGFIGGILTPLVSGLFSLEKIIYYIELFLEDEAAAFDAIHDALTQLGVIATILSVLKIVICVPVGIVGVLFGTKAIKCFRNESRAGNIKPIATLICGIVGVVLNATRLLTVLSLI